MIKRELPLHLVRYVEVKRPRRVSAKSETSYPKGHFTEMIRKHRWPPMFEPQLGNPVEAWRSEIARANREARVEKGDFGTIRGLTKKATDHPVQHRIAAHVRRKS